MWVIPDIAAFSGSQAPAWELSWTQSSALRMIAMSNIIRFHISSAKQELGTRVKAKKWRHGGPPTDFFGAICMKTVIIRPERCVGCLQCRLACAVEHSASKNLYAAIIEAPASGPAAHLSGGRISPFPTSAATATGPCQEVCIAGAIKRTPPGARWTSIPSAASAAPCAPWLPFGSSPTPARCGPDKAAVALKCDQARPGESRPDPGLCYGLQGGGTDLRDWQRPGRPRPGHCPGLLRARPRRRRSPGHPPSIRLCASWG